jgi:hypothetical protein
MKQSKKTIATLLRTNTALLFLCIISLGVLYIAVHQSQESSTPVQEQKIIASTSGNSSDSSTPTPEQALALSPLRNMPVPSTFTSFLYSGQKEFSLPITCKDSYAVTLLFRATVDYRIDTLSAIYNNAAPCVSSKAATTTIPLSSSLIQGERYYVIRASEGSHGMWHDPY